MKPSYRAIKTRARGRTKVRYAAVIRYDNGSVLTLTRRRFYTAEDARAAAAEHIVYLTELYGPDQPS